jgi:hypothetical protein
VLSNAGAQLMSPRNWLHRLISFLSDLRASRGPSMRMPATRPRSQSKNRPLRIARYNLVLMDQDGQVVWTREWDSGGVFEFRRRQRLWIFCGFTNHSECETEISEYEVELMSEDGSIIERFNNSFGDPVIILPGEQKHFQAEWRM